MKKLIQAAFVTAAALALASCGSSDDASSDATADNVEMPADEALSAQGVEAPVADDAAATEDEDASTDAVAQAESAAESGADTAAAAEAALAETE